MLDLDFKCYLPCFSQKIGIFYTIKIYRSINVNFVQGVQRITFTVFAFDISYNTFD